MGLSFEEKKNLVSEVHDYFLNSGSIVAADYTGLTVSQMTDLRKKAREIGVTVKVLKNTLARKAVKGTEHEVMADNLVGPLLYIVSSEDPGAGARLVKEFIKSNDRLVAKVIAFSGEVRPGEDLNVLAGLPTIDEARSRLLSLLIQPQTSLVRLLKEPSGLVVRLLINKNGASEKSAE